MKKSKYRNRDLVTSRKQIGKLPTETLLEAKRFIQKLQRYKKASKLYTTHISGVRKALAKTGNGRVYFDFKFDGTRTGRLSCSRYLDIGVSFHTLPREDPIANIRRMFISDEGFGFLTADYKTMELRIIAHLADDPNMKKAFLEGIDLHTFTASLLYKVPPEKVTKKQRQIAKAISFLISYGGSEFNLANDQNISMEEATSVMRAYKKTFPRMFAYMEERHRFILEHKYSQTIINRRRNLPNITSNVPSVRNGCLRQGFNQEVQATANDFLICATIDTELEFKLQNMKSWIIANVHDSMEGCIHFDEIGKALPIIRRNMVDSTWFKSAFGIELSVPLDVEMIFGHSFGDGVEVMFNADNNITNRSEIDEYFNLHRANELIG